jgi:hypothetical protein
MTVAGVTGGRVRVFTVAALMTLVVIAVLIGYS